MGFPDDGRRLVGPVRYSTERVVEVWHWTPQLLSFRLTRPGEYRFTPGHYARLGLEADGDTVWRPLSMVSSTAQPFLEFVVVLVPGGAFSSRLTGIGEGSEMLLDQGCYGFLTLDQLAPGEELWLFASGTGIGPFISILRQGDLWGAFRRVTLIHSVRQAEELVYADYLRGLGKERTGFRYIPIVTRPPFGGQYSVRIPQLLADGRLEEDVGTRLDPAGARVLVCGNPEMSKELRALLSARGFQTGRRGLRGQMAFEKYW